MQIACMNTCDNTLQYGTCSSDALLAAWYTAYMKHTVHAPAMLGQTSKEAQLMTIVFTLLSLVFAGLAYWRYG